MKVQADLNAMKDKNKQLEKELASDPMSMSQQFSDQKSLIDDLNTYIKTKVGIESVLKAHATAE